MDAGCKDLGSVIYQLPIISIPHVLHYHRSATHRLFKVRTERATEIIVFSNLQIPEVAQPIANSGQRFGFFSHAQLQRAEQSREEKRREEGWERAEEGFSLNDWWRKQHVKQ